MKKLVLFPVLLCICFCTTAADRTWTGAGAGGAGTDFNNSSNWSGSGALLSSDNLIVTLTSNSNVTLTLSANLTVNSLAITGSVSGVGNGGRTFTLSAGNYTFTVSGNTSIVNSSAPAGNQSTRPYSMTISVGSSGTLNLGGTLTVNNSNVSFSDNNIVFSVLGTMTVAGTTTITSLNTSTSSYVAFRADNSPSSVTFNGNTIFDDATSASGNYIEIGGNISGATGKFVFKNNVTFGERSFVNTNFSAGKFVFDGASSQTITDNTSDYYLVPGYITIGSSNSPSVTLTANGHSHPGLYMYNDLTVSNGASLTLSSGATLNNWMANTGGSATGTLSVLGASSLKLAGSSGGITGSNFPNKFATVTMDSVSTTEFSGSSQTVPLPTSSAVYGNITLSGTGTKTLGGNIAMYRALNVSSGVTMDLSTYTCTLKSNAQTTAYITSVSGTPFTYGTGGNFIIERYMPAKTAWRFLATPVTTGSSPSVYSSWQESGSFASTGYGTRITGPSGTGLDGTSNGYSMKYYDMSTDTYIPVTNTGNSIANNAGYMVYVRGDRSIAPGGTANVTNMRIKGQVRTGNQSFTVSANKYQSIGNPFASRIDMRNITKSGVVNAFIVWNPYSAGIYNAGTYDTYTYDGTNYKSTSGTVRNYIESGEAFFIQSLTGGSVTIPESAKATGSSNTSFIGDHPGPEFHLDLYAPDAATGSYLTDGVQISFGEQYSNGVDNEDVRKIMNTADNIAIVKAGYKLVVERHSVLSQTDTVQLNLTGTRTGQYKFKISWSGINGVALTGILKDKFTGAETTVSLYNETVISFDITSDPLSKTADRFMIVFRAATALPVFISGISARRQTNESVAVNWKTENEINIDHYDVEKSADGNSFTFLVQQNAQNISSADYSYTDSKAGRSVIYYRVKAISTGGSVQYSSVVKVNGTGDAAQSITVFPNPVSDHIIHLQMNMQPAGRYSIQLMNTDGEVILAKSVTVNNTFEQLNIPVENNVTGGLYLLNITSPAGDRSVQKVMIR